MKAFFKYLYLIISVLTILEYLFVAGMFTAPIVMALVWIVGIINVAFSVMDRDFYTVCLYLISMIALNMGYWQLM